MFFNNSSRMGSNGDTTKICPSRYVNELNRQDLDGKSTKTSGIGIIIPGDDLHKLPKTLAVPTMAWGYTNEELGLSYGTAVYVPFTAGFVRPTDDPGGYSGETMSLFISTK